ncbi:MAG: hypothetical protein KIT14_12605 [bacterium]|nr:hypothetical protein [bacterium]
MAYEVPNACGSDRDHLRLDHHDLKAMSDLELRREMWRVGAAIGAIDDDHHPDLPWLLERDHAIGEERRARAVAYYDNGRRVRAAASRN